MERKPKVIIVGGGFGGLEAAKSLAKAPVEVTVVDRRNHHLFQPLLYQVATAALSPAEVAWPIRRILRKQANARVLMAEVTGVDVRRREVLFGTPASLTISWWSRAAPCTRGSGMTSGRRTLRD